jgi:hypothetical protein
MRGGGKAWCAAALAAAVAAGAAWAGLGRGGEQARRRGVFEGTSRRGSIQEALDIAVETALRAQPGADRLVTYRVREITGQRGGFAGQNLVRVSIETEREWDGGGNRPPLPEPPALEARMEVLPGPVLRTGRAVLRFTVRNAGPAPVALVFPSGQKYEFEVLRGAQPVWTWSRGRFFTQALVRQEVRPGAVLRYEEVWDLRDAEGRRVPPGRYEIRATLRATNLERPIGAYAAVEVAE